MKKLLFAFVLTFMTGISFANNILVQNVTTTGNNATNKTIQVQFDLSWENSWRDAINWDAAWVFMKFKDANGVWQHAQLNTTGFANGTGTANTMQVTSDKVGCWVYRSAQGSGTFNNTNMQLQWNYGLSGLTSVTGLEVRVFAVEMVYVPEGDFVCPDGYAKVVGTEADPLGFNHLIINNRLSPSFSTNLYSSGNTQRVNGNVGLDFDNNGIIENTSFPTGYKSFYIFKYEMTGQQYADFLNTLTPLQVSSIGADVSSITSSNGQYYSNAPYDPCFTSHYTSEFFVKFYSFADWTGLRPMSELEFYKAWYGPLIPPFYSYNGYNSIPNIFISVEPDGKYNATYFGINDYRFFNATVSVPMISLSNHSFIAVNGNGNLLNGGIHDVDNWNNINFSQVLFVDLSPPGAAWGFRYVRSAE
jgi:hypothetical protein